ncbi:MAG: LacI family DNA-binding transcriptional regulator [Tissierellia bacterium]|nr:LacI family DNA-binding transcriptional regulator [Tissierellia bacterium]
MASTIKDVAKMADVSISTVSRVINDSKPVSPEARRRVLHAIEVLDYKPNELARSLVTKKSNLIGVIVEDIGSTYVSQILRGVEEIGRMYNYDILLSSSYGDSDTEIKFANLLAQKQVEGIIVISNILNTKLEYRLEEGKIPYIMLNLLYNTEDNFRVNVNFEQASYNMVQYLIEKGHRNIASLAIRKDIDRTSELKKVKGYEQAMEKEGLEQVKLFTNGSSFQEVQAIKDEILRTIEEKELTAIVTTQDEMAIHLMNLLFDEGIKVPEDLSITGFGGSRMSDIYRPKLTTVKIPYYDLGAVAIRRILKEIAKEKAQDPNEVVLPAQILKRESVKELK